MPYTLLFLALLSFSAPALAIYKCESGGKISYSDVPCHGDKTKSDMKEIAVAAPPSHPEAAQQRLAQDKKELQHLEALRHKNEVIAEKERHKMFKASEAQKKKCAELALRTKWADEDAVSAKGKSAERTKRTARRATEKYQLECGHSEKLISSK